MSRRFLDLLTCHFVAKAGTALVTLAGMSWLFLLPSQLSGHAANPYLGLLAFIAIPAVFFLGLALIPIGALLAKRHPVVAMRKAGLFFTIMTGINILIGSQVTYRAVTHMESAQFCGASCHVMAPQLDAHARSPHAKVECTECHVTPGAAGWIKAKSAGTRQLMEVLMNTYPRPVPPALQTGRLASSEETCERCHSRERTAQVKLVVKTKYADDEKNTRTQTVLSIQTGLIHGKHVGKLACADCHNRIGHDFPSAEEAVDRAMEAGELDPGVPFMKRDALKTLLGDRDKWTAPIAKIASQHLYPDLKVSWSQYPNFLGHDGCARCHDAGQLECTSCHQALAIDEVSPEIATTLGLFTKGPSTK